MFNTSLPTELLHQVLMANAIEVLKYDPDARLEECYSGRQHSLFPYIAEAFLAEVRSISLFGGNKNREFPISVWLKQVAESHGSLYLIPLGPQSELPPWIAAAFASSGQWGLCETYDEAECAALIRPSWSQVGLPITGRTAWKIVYNRTKHSAEIRRPPLEKATNHLRSLLEESRDFSLEYRGGQFIDIFDRSLSALEKCEEYSKYGGLILNEMAFKENARALFECAATCWVFGGAGSWTDCPPQDPTITGKYDDLTRRLFSSLFEAILSSVNSGRHQDKTRAH